MSRFLDDRGHPLSLGPEVGRGGEGTVYRLAGQETQAIKIYSSPLTADRARKISILSRWDQRQVSRFAAWPASLVVDERGRACGLTLPFVEGGKDVHHLYTPSSRRRQFPTANWRFLVRVSANVARAFAAVHQLGLVIGDVNPGSIMVLPDGTVRLIDVDSFQVPVPGQRPLLCNVAVPLFLPPELNGASLNSVVRTADHDAFGLAVTIFQLLMLGRHPFAGRYLGTGEMPIERAIIEHRFAYSRLAAGRDMLRPPNTVGLEILSPPVAAMFEEAFAPSAGQRPRPSATEWVRSLETMAANLLQCGRNSTHQYARESPQCPWCIFEQSTNVLLFGVTSSTSSQGYEIDYQKLMKVAAAVPRPSPSAPVLVLPDVVADSTASAARGTPGATWVWYLIGAVLILGGLPLLPVGVLMMGLGAGAVALGVLERKRRLSPWTKAYQTAKAQHAAAVTTLEQSNRFPQYTAARATLARVTQTWQDLPRLKIEKYQELHRNKRKVQLQQYLQSKPIDSAGIKGVGRGRVAMLSAYGVDTAADVHSFRISQVPQFGPVLTDRLMAWRDGVERAFVYDSSSPLPPEAIARAEKDLDDAQRRVLEELRRAVRDLQSAAAVESAATAAAAKQLAAAANSLRQAEANVLAATGKAAA